LFVVLGNIDFNSYMTEVVIKEQPVPTVSLIAEPP
jgi:hypothetical protein